MDPVQLQAQLKQIPFFERFDETQFSHLIEKGEIREYPAEHYLFRENDEALELFLILKGEVQILGTNAKGEFVDLAHLQSGQFFGELALADGGERTASAVTLEASQCFVLSRMAFIQLLSESPQLLSEVISSISQKIRSSNTQYFEEQLDKQARLLNMEQERNQLLSQLVTGVAHEFNTPLGIMKTSANIFEEMIQDLQLNEQDKDDLRDTSQLINTQVDRMHYLIQTFKSISPSEIYAQLEAVEWDVQMQEFLKLYQGNSYRDLKLNVEITEAAQAQTWWGYPDILNEILMNLFLNVELHAYPLEDGAVDLKLDYADGMFKLALQDYGRGMPPDVLAQAFRPFVTTERMQGCSGLGLAVVHNLVVYALRGSVEMRSTPDQGSCVTLIFPERVQTGQELEQELEEV